MSYNSLFTFPQVFPTTRNVSKDYQKIGQDFVNKYVYLSQINIANTNIYYEPNSLISLHIHQSNTNKLYEMVGLENLKNQLLSFNIGKIKYDNLVTTFQPLENDKIIINFHGKSEINNTKYNVAWNAIIRLSGSEEKIINQMICLFL